MQSNGFSCEVADVVTLNEVFVDINNIPMTSSYISVATTGTEGSIVFTNPQGQNCYWPFAFIGYNPISATAILSSATINGVLRTTTATNLGWSASYKR